MKIIRGRLNPADVSNPMFRYDATCDCIQQTPDNGATWVDVASADPRHSVGFLKPPVAGSNKQCDAAANMVKWLKDFIDYETGLMVAGATITTLINGILTPLDLLFPAADFLSLIIDIAETIFGIGAAGLTTAFTSTEYDALLCIFYCQIDINGQVSAEKLSVIEGQVTAQLNTTAALVVNSILFVQGEVGLSNAGSVGSEVGDCSACACEWCLEKNLADTDFSMTPATIAEWGVISAYTPGSGFVAGIDVNRGIPAEHASFFEVDRLMPDAHYTHIEIDVAITMGDTAIIGGQIDVYLGDVRLFAITSDTSGTLTWDGDITTSAGHLTLGRGNNVLGYNNTSGSAGGSGLWSRLLMKGTGASNPFGEENNCE